MLLVVSATPLHGQIHLVGIKNLLTGKVANIAKENMVAQETVIEANFAHEVAFVTVLGGKTMVTKIFSQATNASALLQTLPSAKGTKRKSALDSFLHI